ncbi:MAG TPA: MFS transporter [Acetobacteraceae bacterium]|nr:MFS transporter [Acetobacteraceae bacterium]
MTAAAIRRRQLLAYALLNFGFFFFDTAMGLFDVSTYGYFTALRVAPVFFALDFVMVSVPMMLGGWLAHLLNRRFGVRRVIGGGYAVSTAGFVLLYVTGLYLLPACLLFVSFLLGLLFSAILPALSRFIRDVFGSGRGAVLALRLDAIFMAFGMAAGVGAGSIYFLREGIRVFFPLAMALFALAGLIHALTLLMPDVLADYAGPEAPARWTAALSAMRRVEAQWRILLLGPSMLMVSVPLMVGLPAYAEHEHYPFIPVIGAVAAPTIVLAARRIGMLAGRLIAPEALLARMIRRRYGALPLMAGFLALYGGAFLARSLALIFALVFCAHVLSNIINGAVFYGVQTMFPDTETAAAQALQNQISTGAMVVAAILASLLMAAAPPEATIGLSALGLGLGAFALRGSGPRALQAAAARPISD